MKITTIESKTVALPIDNVDTDQIIPARFLKTTTRQGLGKSLFADWRFDDKGQPRPEFALNKRDAEGAQVLVAGENFGCGSSREHAPWALTDFGFRAVVSTSIADIFRGNAVKNGLVPVVVDARTHALLLASPGAEVTIDLLQLTLTSGGRTASFPLDPFARFCLLNGTDELGFLLAQGDAIAAFERSREDA